MRSPLAWLFPSLFLLLVAFVSTFVPPFQAPDEPAHVLRAYLLARGELVLERPASGGMPGGEVDAGLISFIDHFGHVPFNRDTRVSPEVAATAARERWTGSTVFAATPAAAYFPLIYAPIAAGLSIGQAAGATVETSYRLARILVMAAIAAVLAAAFALERPPLGVMALLLMPMTVFLATSAVIDGLATALAVLVISAFLATVRDPGSRSHWLVVIMCMAAFVLVTARPFALPLVVLPMVAAIRLRSMTGVGLGVVSAVTGVAWLVFYSGAMGEPPRGQAPPGAELVVHYLTNPGQFASILIATVADPAYRLGYQRSFIGVLGWLDAPLRPSAYVWLGSLLLIAVAGSLQWRGWSTQVGVRVLLAVLALVSITLIFAMLLVTWTPHPADRIEGVQGRYFVIPVLLFIYALAGVEEERWTRLRALMAGATLLVIGVSTLVLTTSALQARYFGT